MATVDTEEYVGVWVNIVVYGPSDEEQQMNGTITSTYNSLMQMTWDTTRGYIYSATQNNGRVVQTSGPQMGTISYGYDSLNRLTSASSSAGWGETFTYDGFGRKQCERLVPRFLRAVYQLRQAGLAQLVQLGQTLASG